MPRKGTGMLNPELRMHTGARTKLNVAGGHRSGTVTGEYVDPERIAAWNSGLDRLALPANLREHTMAVVLIHAFTHDLEPLPVLEMLADQHASMDEAARMQARKGR